MTNSAEIFENEPGASFAALPAAFDAVLFDFDGVIVESTQIKTDAFRELFVEYPRHVDQIVALHERNAGVSRLIKFDMIYRDILRLPLSDADRQSLADRFQRLVLEKVIACPMVPGALDLLRFLSRKISLAVVSGTPEDELRQIVAKRDLAGYFVTVNGSPRTKADIIGALLSEKRWSPGRVLMIGDAIEDFKAASATAVRFVGRVTQGRANPFPAGTVVVEDMVHLTAVSRLPGCFETIPAESLVTQ
jgi:HAD superfamily hydrolase (TIGR01549 family)